MKNEDALREIGYNFPTIVDWNSGGVSPFVMDTHCIRESVGITNFLVVLHDTTHQV